MEHHDDRPDGGPDETGPDLPVLLIVDTDREARVAATLRRRFAPDYRVLVAESPEAALAAVEGVFGHAISVDSA